METLYSRQYENRVDWQNTPSTNTPLSAEKLNIMDKGLYDIDAEAKSAIDELVAMIESGGGSSILSIFGTPSSNNPSTGRITVGAASSMSGHDAYEAFGNNVDGWINDRAFTGGYIEYEFTNGEKYRPVRLELCGVFDADDVENVRVKPKYINVSATSDGVTYMPLAVRLAPKTLNEIISVDIDSNEYYYKFRFQVAGADSPDTYAGIKNIKIYGEKETSGSGGISFPPMETVNGIIGTYGLDDEVKWVTHDGRGGQNAAFYPNTEDNVNLDVFQDGKPFKIHIRFAFSGYMSGRQQALCGSWNSFYDAPSIEIHGDESITAFYSIEGAGATWTNYATVDYNFQAGAIYVVEYEWDGAVMTLRLYDGSGDLLGEDSDNVTTPYHGSSAPDAFCIGSAHGGGNVSEHAWFDISDTYIEIDGVQVWGNKGGTSPAPQPSGSEYLMKNGQTEATFSLSNASGGAYTASETNALGVYPHLGSWYTQLDLTDIKAILVHFSGVTNNQYAYVGVGDTIGYNTSATNLDKAKKGLITADEDQAYWLDVSEETGNSYLQFTGGYNAYGKVRDIILIKS